MTTYKSGQEAIDEGLITDSQWQQAMLHPWTWVIVSDTLRIRELPWRGLELEVTDIEYYKHKYDNVEFLTPSEAVCLLDAFTNEAMRLYGKVNKQAELYLKLKRIACLV